MRIFLFFSLLLLSLKSFAYYSTMDTADLVEHGHFNANAELQFITEGDSGVNLIGHFDGRLGEDSGYRVELGFGVVDFQLAGFYKWNPIPDVDNQPGISLLAGVALATIEYDVGNKSDTATDLSLRATPILSKKYNVDFGKVTPYLSLPLGIRTVEGDTDFTVQLTIGSKVSPEKFEHLSFMGEIGFDISEAFTYFSIGVNLSVDPDNGIQFN